MSVPNILLVSGTGRNTGKTTFSCGIIEKFRTMAIVAIKISPHFHKVQGYIPVEEKPGSYQIFSETKHGTGKDSSRMLDAGASQVYYIQARREEQHEAFEKLFPLIPAGVPVICESGGLPEIVIPGLHVLMTSGETTGNFKKGNSNPDLVITFLPEKKIASVEKIQFSNGCWEYSHQIHHQ